MYDVIIIGGGPAGLSAAALLAPSRLNILILEKQAEQQLADPDYDGREIALTHLSKKIMTDSGMWGLMPPESISQITQAEVFNEDSKDSLKFSYTETDKTKLGFMVANNVIKKAAYDLIKRHSNIHLKTGVEVKSTGVSIEKSWVELTDGSVIDSQMLVSADSRLSATRRQMGIATHMLDFGRSCIVSTMTTEKSHHNTACEYFFYDRTLAVLPLQDNKVSIVITVKSEYTNDLLAMDREELALGIQTQLNDQFGQMTFDNELYPYPLVATLAKQFYGYRYALIGDAAVGMHPVTAHGYNLGLRGAHTLATTIKQAKAQNKIWFSVECLRPFGEKHHRICRTLFHGTNLIVTLYTKDHQVARLTRKLLLKASQRIKPLKRLITNQLTEAQG